MFHHPKKKRKHKEVRVSTDESSTDTEPKSQNKNKKPRKKPVKIPILDPKKEEEMIDKIKDASFIWNKTTDGRFNTEKRRAFWKDLDDEFYDGQYDMARRFYTQARTKLGKITNYIATAKHSGAGLDDLKLTDKEKECMDKWGFMEDDIEPIASRNGADLVVNRVKKIKKKQATRADLLKQAEEAENHTMKAIQDSIKSLQHQLAQPTPTPPAAAPGSQRKADLAQQYGDTLTNEMRRMADDDMRNYFMYCMAAVTRFRQQQQQQHVYQPVPVTQNYNLPPPTLTPIRHQPQLPPNFTQPPAGAFNPYVAPAITTATTSATVTTPSPVFGQTDGTCDIQSTEDIQVATDLEAQQQAIFHI